MAEGPPAQQATPQSHEAPRHQPGGSESPGESTPQTAPHGLGEADRLAGIAKSADYLARSLPDANSAFRNGLEQFHRTCDAINNDIENLRPRAHATDEKSFAAFLAVRVNASAGSDAATAECQKNEDAFTELARVNRQLMEQVVCALPERYRALRVVRDLHLYRGDLQSYGGESHKRLGPLTTVDCAAAVAEWRDIYP